MSNIEMKLDAIMRCLTADNNDDREQARVDMRSLMEQANPEVAPKLPAERVENIIINTLLDLGVPAHIKGYRYLVTALSLVIENPDIQEAITKELYPQIAKTHNSTGSRVERAIRHAVECAWDRGDLDVLKRYFGNTISCCKGKPTNSEFIAQVAVHICRRLNGAE